MSLTLRRLEATEDLVGLRLDAVQRSLVQTLLSSSHTGYGLASLDQDADELHQLATHLKAECGSQVLRQQLHGGRGFGARRSHAPGAKRPPQCLC